LLAVASSALSTGLGAWAAPLAVLGASTALIALAAVLAPRNAAVAVVLSLVALLGLPWLAGPVPLVRGLFALNFFGTFRVVDLVRSREPWGAGRRVAHALSLLDSRLLRRERPRLDLPGLGAALAWSGLALFALQVVKRFAPQPADPPWIRWGAGLVFTYAAIEAGYRTVRSAHRAVGFETPPLHVWPIASLTVAEFWGVRWARPVSHWLRANCFLPLARRGHPALGLLLGFVVSAWTHAYPVLVALGPALAAAMFGYFLLQGFAVTAENRLGIAKWPRALRRTWTVGTMVAASPLFVEPCLRVVLSDGG